MRDAASEGRLQVTAAMSLLKVSHLMEWDTRPAELTPVPRDCFEFAWRSNVDPIFGRFICWLNFSAGAELLAKGVCLIHNVDMRKPVGNGAKFGTLGTLCQPNGALEKLCDVVQAEEKTKQSLLGAYKRLAKDIRNRDAHVYEPDVRDNHFHLVSDTFVPCFNLLISWLPDGGQTVNKWKHEASQFIASLA